MESLGRTYTKLGLWRFITSESEHSFLTVGLEIKSCSSDNRCSDRPAWSAVAALRHRLGLEQSGVLGPLVGHLGISSPVADAPTTVVVSHCDNTRAPPAAQVKSSPFTFKIISARCPESDSESMNEPSEGLYHKPPQARNLNRCPRVLGPF